MSFSRRFEPMALHKFVVDDAFWSPRLDKLRSVTIPTQYEQLELTGRLERFRIAAGTAQGKCRGLRFDDSDVYKWLEAAAYALVPGSDAVIEQQVSETIKLIEAAQEPDGYINTYFQILYPDAKWRNLSMMHEMYCIGHLIEAAVALQECAGIKGLMPVARRSADHVMSIFGPGRRRGYPGHQEFEWALFRLAAATGEAAYSEFAIWLMEERGKRPTVFEAEMSDSKAMALSDYAPKLMMQGSEYSGEYNQDHAPIREHTVVVGHAVRAMYLYAAAAEWAKGAQDPKLEDALIRLWTNLTARRMYITGGIGPSDHNEGFTSDFDLPNRTAYAETCAAYGLILWGARMLEATGDSAFADIIERALLNGALSGISLSGDQYFYTNPLESRGEHHRVPWFLCACCPPNIARLIGSVASYAYGTGEQDLWIHFPIGGEGTLTIGSEEVRFKVSTQYPWSGSSTVEFQMKKPTRFRLHVRIPDWCEDASLEVADAAEEADFEQGYAVLERVWQPGDQAKFEWAMAPKWNVSHPMVLENCGRMALSVGPLIFALEQHDSKVPPQRVSVNPEVEVTTRFEPELLGGVLCCDVPAIALQDSFDDLLYGEAQSLSYAECTVSMIPYYSWCNRGATSMQVWILSHE